MTTSGLPVEVLAVFALLLLTYFTGEVVIWITERVNSDADYGTNWLSSIRGWLLRSWPNNGQGGYTVPWLWRPLHWILLVMDCTWFLLFHTFGKKAR